jgi:dephospho-CoA kinase
MAAQMSLEERAAAADVLLDNEGTEAELEAQVDRLWADLSERAARA